jgi:hypothetical protein
VVVEQSTVAQRLELLDLVVLVVVVAVVHYNKTERSKPLLVEQSILVVAAVVTLVLVDHSLVDLVLLY